MPESLVTAGLAGPSLHERLRTSWIRLAAVVALALLLVGAWEAGTWTDYGVTTHRLYRAAETGDVRRVLWVLDRLGGSGGYANAALARATGKGQRAVVEAVLPRTGRGGRSRAVRVAVESGHPELIASIATLGVDLEGSDPEGRTLLMLTAVEGEPSSVAALLAAGADPRRKGTDGKSALDLALAARKPEAARLIDAALQERGRSGSPAPGPSVE